MEVIPVTDKKTVDAFHKVPEKIYKNDSNWIPSLRMMIETLLTRKGMPVLKQVMPVVGY
ncbi:hypothetical protein [uncultured Draconibacterium sp.]|uniref:hypothetical protein n=1 Tax=uncultured Draconibacterium sp. TaxID=1573823 RepID=UPI003216A9AE